MIPATAQLGQAHQLLSDEQARLLGFENPALDWSSNNGSPIQSSTTRVQGEASLSVAPNGYTIINSTTIAAPGDALTAATYQLSVPVALSWGEARLVLEAPSAGIHSRDLGGSPLTGLAPNEFHTLTFSLPSDVRDALNGAATDVSFKVIINAPSGVGNFLIDDLRVSQNDGSGEVAGDTTESFVFSVPGGIPASNVVLSGTNGVVVDDRCTIESPAGHSTIAGFAPGGVHLGAQSTVLGSVQSTAEVWLRSQSTVEGNVTASRDIIEQDNVTIGGVKAEGGAVRQVEGGWSIAWPSESRGDVTLPTDAPNRELLAGAYGTVQAFSRSTLTLQSGTYFFDELIFEPEAHLRVDTRNGPLVIYVRNTLRLRVGLEYLPGSDAGVLVGYLGDTPALFEEAIVATLVAPNSTIELRRPSNGLPHKGTFFGQSVHVFSDATVIHGAFNFNVLCDSGVFGEASCIGEVASPTDYVARQFLLPQGVLPTDVVVAARRNVEIGVGASVDAAIDGGSDQIIAVAEGGISVRSNATVPGLAAPQSVVIEAGATVSGDVRTDVPIALDNGASIGGTTSESAGLAPPVSYPFTLAFTSPVDGDVLIATGRSKIVLPGSYGKIRVEQGGTLYLRSGEYSASEFVVDDGASIVLMPDSGQVEVSVEAHLSFQGIVSSLSQVNPGLSIYYGGVARAWLRGKFSGLLLAPAATLDIGAGPHQGIFYGADVLVAENTSITPGDFPWEKLFERLKEPDAIVTPDLELPGSLEASGANPAQVTKASGFDFAVPRRIPVRVGNAGNGTATFLMTRDTGVPLTCNYRGGASIASPTTLLDIARGREYEFESCSDGTAPGTVLRLTEISLQLTGDPQHPAGDVKVNVPLDRGCEGDLPLPISLAESRELFEDFEWPAGSPPFFQDGLVPETVDGSASLFYAQIYVTSRDELALLDQFLIHWDKDPLFPEEWPEDWNNVCGTLHYDHDGQGMWVWAALSGEMYNAILLARTSPSVEPSQREVFKAIRILGPPDYLATSEGSLDLAGWAEAGFQYRGLSGIPDAVALQEALFEGGKAAATFANASKWIWDRGKGALQTFAQVLSFWDKKWGTVHMTLDIDVLTKDPTFLAGTTLQRAWGSGSGGQIAPQGAKVNLWTTSVRLDSPIPFRRLDTDRMSRNGFVSMNVAKSFSDLRGSVQFNRLCIELENDAGYITTFLGASSICNRSFRPSEYRNFEHDFDLEWKVDNRNARHLTEVTDSYKYLEEVVGERAKQAVVLVGPNATVLSAFNDDNAAALCLGYGDFTADAVVLLVNNALGYVVPIAGAAAATYLSILSNTDILVTDNSFAKDTRGLMTHEYGHYALCDLVRKNGESLTADVLLTYDSLRTGANDPGPDDEARVVNEAFADFFSMQIASGVNYSWLRHLDDSASGIFGAGSVTWALNRGFYFSTDIPGADTDIFGPDSDVYGPSLDVDSYSIGRLAGLMHDLFDGRPHGSDGPGSADAWFRWSPSDPVTHRNGGPPCVSGWSTSPHCRHGDVDLEQVVLGGAKIRRAVKNFQDARNLLGAYRVRAMEKGLIDTALESTTWCQACLASATHFYGHRQNPADPHGKPFARDLIEACQIGEKLEQYMGPPPRPTQELNAFTCEPCPTGLGMGREGTCTACPVDETIFWDGVACTSQVAEYSTDPLTDFCPQTFIVEVRNANNGTPATDLQISVVNPPSSELVCIASRLSGNVTYQEAGSATDFQVGSFFIPGEYRECEIDASSNICVDGSSGCFYPHPWEAPDTSRGGNYLHVPLASLPASSLRVVAEAGNSGVNVTVGHDAPSCHPVVR